MRFFFFFSLSFRSLALAKPASHHHFSPL